LKCIFSLKALFLWVKYPCCQITCDYEHLHLKGNCQEILDPVFFFISQPNLGFWWTGQNRCAYTYGFVFTEIYSTIKNEFLESKWHRGNPPCSGIYVLRRSFFRGVIVTTEITDNEVKHFCYGNDTAEIVAKEFISIYSNLNLLNGSELWFWRNNKRKKLMYTVYIIFK
jgi:hypothetical protein